MGTKTTLFDLETTGCVCGEPNCHITKVGEHGGFRAVYTNGNFTLICPDCETISETIELTTVERLRVDRIFRESGGCDNRDCPQVVLARCHPEAGVGITYWKGNRHVLEFFCADCHRQVFDVVSSAHCPSFYSPHGVN